MVPASEHPTAAFRRGASAERRGADRTGCAALRGSVPRRYGAPSAWARHEGADGRCPCVRRSIWCVWRRSRWRSRVWARPAAAPRPSGSRVHDPRGLARRTWSAGSTPRLASISWSSSGGATQRAYRGRERRLRSEQRVVRPLPVGRRVPGPVLTGRRGRRRGTAVARRRWAPGRQRAGQPAVGGGERQGERRGARARNGSRDVSRGQQRAACDDRGSPRPGGARRDREGVRRPVRRSYAHRHLEPAPEAPGVQERTSVQHVLGREGCRHPASRVRSGRRRMPCAGTRQTSCGARTG